MFINHNCIKDILTVFYESKEAEVSFLNDGFDIVFTSYDNETLKNSADFIVDRQLILSTKRGRPYDIYHYPEPTWSGVEYRIQDTGLRYLAMTENNDLWEALKKISKEEKLDVVYELIIRYSNDYVEDRIDSILNSCSTNV